MAQFDYDKARATAEKIITKFGQPLNLVKKGVTGGYDKYGDPTPDTPDTQIIGIISPLLDYDSGAMKTAIEVNGSAIIAGDKFAFYHTDDVVEIGMIVLVNGVEWRVQSIVQLKSVDGVSVYIKIQLRR